MYKNGIIKIQLSSPSLKVANPLANAYSIKQILNISKASFVIFPELCLSSYTAGDLFFETTFLKENLKALDWLLQNNTYEGVYILGMPLALQEVLFNVAVVIQKDKILGIVPKKTIPNYKEFHEKRWFQSGKTWSSQHIDILSQKVPFGDILFINQQYDVIFGVEICQDLWTIFSPSDILALNGAHLIFNLSSSTEHIGKVIPRQIAVLDHSRKQIGGYFYTSSGITESTVDNLFSNHKIAAVVGQLIGEGDLFNQEHHSLLVDVDIDYIKFQRRIDTTYGDQRIGQEFPFLKAYFTIQEIPLYCFENKFSRTPFITAFPLEHQLKLANKIQTLALKTKLKNVDAKVILEITDDNNDFLTFMVLRQTFALLHKSYHDLIIVLNPQTFKDQNHYQLLKTFLISEKIIHISEHNFFHQKQLLSFLNSGQTPPILLLENNNFSNIAIGNMSTRGYYDHLYNVNVGIPNTLIKELLLFHLTKDFWKNHQTLQSLYQQKTKNMISEKLLIEDFILFNYIKNGYEKDKMAWLLEQTFNFNQKESQALVTSYLKLFHQSQFKRQYMAPGPKILENSLSPRNEYRLPIDLQRQ
ncbi:NAD+ synthetase ['Fragaria x ananassa' phyllody phytoplasma]|uniref:Glutamine-dependent NAD(+) synthetase n=1 Tax='Fragaria x ananassa' phyllody phytoplasma TaxID=2358428 RepID=A0ABS5K2U4_9MOLU|nr:nitrilase-related carbon-nitrogen hydrolase ['Fragaria x ananassa' phyllody phytoplasma]MBS2126199.1 NAD+ synthetase ['Fragaria x ananassa' phyllody phytoplasma]